MDQGLEINCSSLPWPRLCRKRPLYKKKMKEEKKIYIITFDFVLRSSPSASQFFSTHFLRSVNSSTRDNGWWTGYDHKCWKITSHNLIAQSDETEKIIWWSMFITFHLSILSPVRNKSNYIIQNFEFWILWREFKLSLTIKDGP